VKAFAQIDLTNMPPSTVISSCPISPEAAQPFSAVIIYPFPGIRMGLPVEKVGFHQTLLVLSEVCPVVGALSLEGLGVLCGRAPVRGVSSPTQLEGTSSLASEAPR
jgi:hypothetical protein